MKIRAYLALMTIAILVPVVIFSAATFNMLLSAEREAALRGARETVRASVLRVDKELSNAETALRVLANSHELQNENWADFYKLAKAANTSTDIWTLVLDEKGQQIFNTVVPFGTRMPPADAKLFAEVQHLDKPQVSNLIIGPVAKVPVVGFRFPVTLPNGKRIVLIQSFRASYFDRMLYSPENSANTIMGIFDRTNVTIARNVRAGEFVGKPPGSDLWKAILASREGTIRNESREGLQIYSLFSTSPLSGWVFTLGVPVMDVEASARHAVRLTAIGLLVVLLCAASAAVLSGRRLSSAISRAVDSATALGQGGTPSNDRSGIYEVDRLNAALAEAGVILQAAESERADLLLRETAARTQAELQNAAKDEFLAMLGHELRNPLAPITSAASLLKLAPLDEARVRQTSDIIARQAGHMSELINDILDVSRVTRGQITLEKCELDAKQIITDAVEQMRPLIDARRHHLVVQLPEESAYVIGDEKRLVQVLSNLLNNAAKYTPEGGKITVRLEVRPAEVLLAVTDNGIGMPPELVGRAFDLFAQAERSSDRTQGGLGLGLALVKTLVTLQGGTVTAQSSVGAGSEFTVILPRVVMSRGVARPGSGGVALTNKSLRILVVDDNVDAASMLAMFLETIGYQVAVAYEPRNALEAARTGRFDIYLLDIGLPEIGGHELARRLKARPENANAILIAITGYGQQNDRASAIGAGFDYYFVKPVDGNELALLLATIADA